jgi:hypothetical protein
LFSCQVYNSGSKDKLLYGSNIDANSNFGKAVAIFSNRCISCHAYFGTYTTEADWVTNGFVTAGDLSASKVYYRLFGANLGIGSEDMPQNSSLTNGELSTIRNWILNM